MPQEMSFAQALTEARQIIVQQSNRIKADLDRVKSVQENLTAQIAATAEAERQNREKTIDLTEANEQIKIVNVKLEEMKVAKEQGEAVIDRQGQRITQMQESIAALEKHLAEQTQKADESVQQLQSMRGQMPTQEDTEALAALSSLLAAKKGASAPPAPPALAA